MRNTKSVQINKFVKSSINKIQEVSMITKRNYYRKAKQEKEKIKKALQNISNNSLVQRSQLLQSDKASGHQTEDLLVSLNVLENFNLDTPTSSNSNLDIPTSSAQQHLPMQFGQDKCLRDKLKTWFLFHKPSVSCSQDLFKILKSEKLDVPLSVVGLLGRYIPCQDRTVSPGKYVHIGLGHQLEKVSEIIEQLQLDTLFLDVGIDGLPFHKSSGVGLWPILGNLVNVESTGVFLIGCYIGIEKPYNINSYLHDFVNEFSDLQRDGIIINDKKVNIQIRAFVCDAPAKAFVCGIKGHTSLIVNKKALGSKEQLHFQLKLV